MVRMPYMDYLALAQTLERQPSEEGLVVGFGRVGVFGVVALFEDHRGAVAGLKEQEKLILNHWI